MLIESMNSKEITQEILRDLPLLLHWQKNKWIDELRSKFAHCKVFPAYAYRTWTSPFKNKWELYFYCKDKKQISQNIKNAWSWIRYDTPYGKGAYTFSYFRTKIERAGVIKYVPHFFQRYRQRFVDPYHIDLTPYDGDIIRYFFHENHTVGTCCDMATHKVYGTVDQGLIFGNEENDNTFYLIKTYINFAILNKKQQKNLMDYLRAARLMSFLPEEIRRTKPGSFKAATQLKG